MVLLPALSVKIKEYDVADKKPNKQPPKDIKGRSIGKQLVENEQSKKKPFKPTQYYLPEKPTRPPKK